MKTAIICVHIATLLMNRTKTSLKKGIKGCRGFTLLEILAAIFILAIVVSLVLSAFDGLFANSDKINISSDLYEMGSACLDRMAADLKAIHVTSSLRYKPPDIDDEKPDIYRVKGGIRDAFGDHFAWLRFTSMAHLPMNHVASDGIAQIVYYVQQTDDGKYELRRADALFPYPEFEDEEEELEGAPVMCEQLLGFELKYYDAKGEEHEEWDSQSADADYSTPRGIGITLKVGDESAPYIFSTQITLPVYRYESAKR